MNSCGCCAADGDFIVTFMLCGFGSSPEATPITAEIPVHTNMFSRKMQNLVLVLIPKEKGGKKHSA